MKKNQLSLALAFEVVMAVFYVGFAYILIRTELFDQMVAENYKLPLGLLLVLYGGFRIYRVARKFKSTASHEDS